jgi:hypothetical protein
MPQRGWTNCATACRWRASAPTPAAARHAKPESGNIRGVPTEPRPVSLADVVRRAAEVVDPEDRDAAVGDFEMAFEDADEPVRAVDDVEARVATVLADLDPTIENGSLSMVGAITVYLSYRRDELHADADELIKLAARSEWDGDPPDVIQDWLADRGIRP